MNIKAILVEKISKGGKPYICVEVSLTEKVKKLVFLSEAEVELLKLMNSK